jgi:hypothetical protein
MLGGYQIFLMLVGSSFHKIDYKRFQFSPFNFLFKFIHWVRVLIFFFKKSIDSHDASFS